MKIASWLYLIINRLYAAYSYFSFRDRMIMNAYEWIDKLKLSITRSLGLDTSNVLIENVPLVVRSRTSNHLNAIPRVERVENEEEENVK